MDGSVYQIIKSSLDGEGRLPAGFSLPEEPGEGIRWAPGAQDGVFIYHMFDPGDAGLSDRQRELMEQGVSALADLNFPAADALFGELTRDRRAVSLVDPLQRCVIDRQAEIDPDDMFNAAVLLMTCSENPECVKIGLELMELFTQVDAGTADVIRTLGAYDEFTLCAIWAFQRSGDLNSEIFEFAKKVRGWGRIHAVERLEPETEEIRSWLLTDGADNDVMSAYSALACWDKSGAEELLFSDPAGIGREQYAGLSLIMGGLLDEGPVPGISQLPDRAEILKRFLELSERFELSEEEECIVSAAEDRLKEEA
jgi:hypothetical protein